MGNNFIKGNNYIVNNLNKKLEIHTKGISDNYCFVLCHDDNTIEPHVGKFVYTRNQVKSEVLAIIKALEYIDFVNIKPDPIYIYTSSSEAIRYIDECVYNRNNVNDRNEISKILFLLSDKNVKFFYSLENIANGYISDIFHV